jgi:site-specific recombinase XerD
MNLKEAVESFIKAKRIENVSDKTLEIYASMTRELVDYIGGIPIKEFSASDVRDFLTYQREREGRFGKLSDATIHKYYAVIRTFSRWLKSQDYKQVSATEKISAPRVEDKLPECLTDDEVMQLFQYLKAYCSERVQLIFSFFLDTGARLSEVVGMNVDDLHLRDGWVKVYGKGRRERILPLGKRLKRDLETYTATIRPMIADEDEKALFVTQHGSRYTKDGMSTLVKSKLKKIGAKGHYGPHKLRHTYATNYLRNGGQLEQLRIVMGHRDISTTQRYLSLVPNDLTKAQQIASPNDKFLNRMG